MDQQKITEKVKEGALPEFQQRIPQEAAGGDAGADSASSRPSGTPTCRSKYLIGNDTAAVRDFLIRQLSMSSRPEAIFVGGRFEWRGAPDQRGADTPQPPKLASTFDPGVTADLHLGSLATSAASGLWQQDKVRSVQNLMIETKAVPPGTPPKDAVSVKENVAFPDYLKAVEAARKAHDPRVQALRIIRPQQPPEFSTDARGYLVALVRDFQLDVPAPDPQAGGNLLGVPAKVLRIKAPLVEVALSYQLDNSTPGSLRLKGKIQEFNPGTDRRGHRHQRRREPGEAADPLPVGDRHERDGDQDPQPEHRHQPRPAPAAGLQDPVDLAAGPLGMGADQPGADGRRTMAPAAARTSSPAR